MRWGSILIDLGKIIFQHFYTTRQHVVTEWNPRPSHSATEEAPAFECSASTDLYSIMSKQSIPWRKKRMEKKNQASEAGRNPRPAPLFLVGGLLLCNLPFTFCPLTSCHLSVRATTSKAHQRKLEGNRNLDSWTVTCVLWSWPHSLELG